MLAATGCRGGILGSGASPSPTVEAGLTANSVVRLRSIGPVVIGMTLDQLQEAARVPIVKQQGFEQAVAEKNCAFVSPGLIPGYVPPPEAGRKSPLAFMIVDGKLARIDVLGGDFATERGIKVGSSEQEVVDAYRGDTPLPPRNFVGPPYRYLTATPRNESDRNFRIVFETDGAKVVKYQVGKLPEVEYREGCEPGARRAAAPTPAPSPTPQNMSVLPQGELRISRNNETLVTLQVRIAETPETQQRGLMFVESLPTLEGMAFIWDEPGNRAFHMKDTLIPLDIAFWDENMRIINIIQMQPCRADPCPVHRSSRPAVGAVEVNQGLFGSEGVRVGDVVTLARR